MEGMKISNHVDFDRQCWCGGVVPWCFIVVAVDE